MANFQSNRRSGGLRGIPLFQLFGIQVSLHISWFVVAFLEISTRAHDYSSIAWNIAEYLTLFIIVLMHEFGHALACRSVGGRADHILLWPLGGVAYVQPPPRPAPYLWSIAAGPLVNVLLIPLTFGLSAAVRQAGGNADLLRYLTSIQWINVVLLVFNLLPLYPLDGGQILRALLWFVIGPARSLLVASILGLIGAVAGISAAFVYLSDNSRIWVAAIGIFAIMRSWAGLKEAFAIQRTLRIPRHPGFKCPTCGESPPALPLARCRCGQQFDLFAADGICPACATPYHAAPCPLCGGVNDWAAWRVSPSPGAAMPRVPQRADPTLKPNPG